jgi:hypothetical protein
LLLVAKDLLLVAKGLLFQKWISVLVILAGADAREARISVIRASVAEKVIDRGGHQSVLALARTNSDSSILAIVSGGEFPT